VKPTDVSKLLIKIALHEADMPVRRQ